MRETIGGCAFCGKKCVDLGNAGAGGLELAVDFGSALLFRGLIGGFTNCSFLFGGATVGLAVAGIGGMTVFGRKWIVLFAGRILVWVGDLDVKRGTRLVEVSLVGPGGLTAWVFRATRFCVFGILIFERGMRRGGGASKPPRVLPSPVDNGPAITGREGRGAIFL